MRKRTWEIVALAGLIMMFASGVLAEVTLLGAGASFPFPLYSQWAQTYRTKSDTRLNYQSIGSGGGIAQIKAETVDFGASDAPLKADELAQFGLIQFPMTMGGVVPVVNVKGIQPGELKLSNAVLADIFLGKITRWNNAAIARLNEGMNLPDQEITVVHRADGSGTTWIFTNFLDKVSPEWHQTVGTAKAVEWPVGVGGKGNEGISRFVKKISGSIGYVEFAYALQNNMAYVQLKNREGHFVAPTIETFQSAAANADWSNAPGFYMVLTVQPGQESWPITGASFILLHKAQKERSVADAMFRFFNWCYTDREAIGIAEKLHYVPIPAEVVAQIQAVWKTDVAVDGTPVWK
jgi:phosphate transport system substrate-binding protein